MAPYGSGTIHVVRPDEEPVYVLLIEDDAVDAELVLRGLAAEAPNLHVQWSMSLAHGLEQLARRAADVLLLDLGLPDARNLESVESTRRQHPGVPIIVLSGRDDSRTIVAAVKCGARDFFVKSRVNYGALRQAIVREKEYARMFNPNPPRRLPNSSAS